MSLYFPLKRTTVLIPSGPKAADGGKHLFVVLTNQCPEKQVLRVSISTVYENAFHDPACLLFPGDHPFLRQKSYVYYRSADTQAVAELVRGVRDGKLEPRESLDEKIFSRICQGLLESRFTPQAAAAYYAANRQR